VSVIRAVSFVAAFSFSVRTGPSTSGLELGFSY